MKIFQIPVIAICDNGNQDIITREKNFMIYRPKENLNVSGSWNMLMDYAAAMEATHVYMLNDDVYLGKTEAQIYEFLQTVPEKPFYNSYQHWSSFILPVKTFELVGEFDQENFPNYFNDNDYCRRLTLAGFDRINSDYLNPEVFRNSMTIQKDPSLNNRFGEYQNNYIKKWGGLPHQETFEKPFNQ